MSDKRRGFSKKETDLIISQLEKDYPKCFNLKESKPLKLGIHKDILERNPDIPKLLLSSALSRYTFRPHYAKILSNSEFRVDLDGNQTEVISDRDKKSAKILYMFFRNRRKDREAKKSTPPL